MLVLCSFSSFSLLSSIPVPDIVNQHYRTDLSSSSPTHTYEKGRKEREKERERKKERHRELFSNLLHNYKSIQTGNNGNKYLKHTNLQAHTHTERKKEKETQREAHRERERERQRVVFQLIW